MEEKRTEIEERKKKEKQEFIDEVNKALDGGMGGQGQGLAGMRDKLKDFLSKKQ